MLTLAEDHANLRNELLALGYGDSEEHQKVVQALLAVHLTLAHAGLTQDAQNTVLDLLTTEGRKALAVTPHYTEQDWRDFDYGNVKLGDFVRVKKDAYDAPSGARHNGLVGILKFMKGGHCTVEYIGLAAGNSQKHPMSKLDSLKWGVQ
jgi:hypothetical protein